MDLDNDIKTRLKEHGADFVHYVDISRLSGEQNKKFPRAVLLGIVLSPGYIRTISEEPVRVRTEEDEFCLKEKKTDRLADDIADYLSEKGYSAYSQSEKNICATGYYNEKKKITPLPHKTIAGLAGLGWIGKHDLLIMPGYGSAVSMCSVLTNAPLETEPCTPGESQCGDCTVCRDICPVNAISGAVWTNGIPRDELVDVFRCISCMQCLALCSWTQKYIRNKKE